MMAAAGGSSPPPPDILKEIDTVPLNLEDDVLYDVKKAVLPIAVRWRDIGIALRLKQGDLDTVETLACPRKCLSEMLTIWLRKKYNVEKFGEPTWRRLVEVVMDPAGGADPALAHSIAEKHRVKRLFRIRSRSADSVNGSMPNRGHYAVATQHHEFVNQATSRRMSLLASFEDWFHGRIPPEDAEWKLAEAPNGCFIIRESCSQPGSFVLSLKHQGEVTHRLVHSFEDSTGSWLYELRGSGMVFKSIIDLVKHYKVHYITADGEKLKIPCPRESGWHMHEGRPSEHSTHTCQLEPTRGRVARVQSMNTKLRLLPSPLEVKKKKLCLSSSNLLETQNRLSELHPRQKLIYLSTENFEELYTPQVPYAPASVGHSTPVDETMATEPRGRSATHTLLRSRPDQKPPKKKSFLDWIRSLKRTKNIMEAYPPPT